MYEDIIRHYWDYPKPGIDFIDLLPLLQHKEAFNDIIRRIDACISAPNVATVEARGFLFTAPLLIQSAKIKTVVPIRKKGKLPYAEGDLQHVAIEKEYGSDDLYYRLSDLAACHSETNTIEIALLDDLLATGGTANGVAQSIQGKTVNGKTIVIKEFVFLAELTYLPGRTMLEQNAPVHSIIQIDQPE